MSVSFLCDYCGGFSASDAEWDKAYPPSPEIKEEHITRPKQYVALRVEQPAIGERLATHIDLCAWCWKKALDHTLRAGNP